MHALDERRDAPFAPYDTFRGFNADTVFADAAGSVGFCSRAILSLVYVLGMLSSPRTRFATWWAAVFVIACLRSGLALPPRRLAPS